MQPLRRNRDFVLLQIGQALSTVGSNMSAVAYPLLTLALTGSAAKAGVVGFAASLPYTLFVLPAGILVDRLNRKRVMIVADAGRAVALASLLVAYAGGLLGYAQVAVVAFVEGAFDPFFNIAETGAIRQVVPRPQLPDAMARDGARRYAGVLVGPPLGGALFGIARVLPFAADCVSYAFSVVTLLAMRTPFQEERVEAPGRLRSQFAGGVRFLWEHAFLRSSAVMFAAGNFAGSALFLLLVVVARQQGYSAGTIGLLVAAIGAVGVVGSFVAPPLQRRVSMRTIVIGNQWLGLALFAFVAYPHAWVLVVAFVPFGLFNPALNAVVISYRMAITPDALQGRVNSVARFVAQIVSPLGPLVAGLLLASTSARVTVGVFALWFAGVAVATTASRSIRRAPSLAELSETDPAPAA